MKFAFDHLVHFVEEPKDMIAALEKQGIYAVEGGVHLNRGTYNTLSYFDLSYIEFLGTYDRELVKKSNHPKYSLMETVVEDGFKEGFERFAIRTTDIEGAAQHFREKGLSVNGPFPLSRKRPDGSIIEWQLLYAGSENEELNLPFIIQWNEKDEERRSDLIERKVIKLHPSKASFSHITIVVKNIDETALKWSNWLGLEKGEAFIDPELNATCKTLYLQGGNIVLASPLGEGVASQILAERGERPFQLNLTSDITNTSFKLHGGLYKISKN